MDKSSYNAYITTVYFASKYFTYHKMREAGKKILGFGLIILSLGLQMNNLKIEYHVEKINNNFSRIPIRS